MAEEVAKKLDEAASYIEVALSHLKRSDQELRDNWRKIMPKAVVSLEKAQTNISEIQEFYKV